MQWMQWLHATVLVLTLACSGAWAQGKADPHRAEDRDKHSKMGEAHAAAAACLMAPGANREACHKQLQTDCRGLAVGPHCGLRAKADEYKDPARHVAEHRRMADIHGAAAQCLASDRSYKDCYADLAKACGGLGVGKYCGMRHGH
jgi:hypothetical protein